MHSQVYKNMQFDLRGFRKHYYQTLALFEEEKHEFNNRMKISQTPRAKALEYQVRKLLYVLAPHPSQAFPSDMCVV